MMTQLFFIGATLFSIYLIVMVFVTKRQKEINNELDYKYYYDRYELKRNKLPKTRKGSQSRMKYYFWNKNQNKVIK